MKKSLLAAASVCLSLSAAQADDMDYVRHVRLSVADLDLANPIGAEVALRRIKFAAKDVCGGKPDTHMDLTASRIYKSCYLDALEEAVRELRAPLVTSLYLREPDHMSIAQTE